MNRKKKWITLAITITAFAIVIVEMFPIVIIVLNGFKRDIDIWSQNPFSFQFTLRSYQKVFARDDFLLGLKNSLIVGLSSTAISILAGAMASYGIARFHFRGRKTVSYSFLISRMVPQISLAIPLYLLFSRIGLRDNLLALVLAYTSFNIPYVIWLLLPFFASIPKTFEEAALVDGCNRKQIFWKIFLPLTAPGLVVASVFAFIMSWNEFIYALILTGNQSKTAPISINGFMGQYAPEWGQLAAAGTLILIPIFVFTLSLQRYIIKGLTAGGIKG
ncbi:MAG TPA: carbohydrate ABC transporter permease [Thermotogota bacterium]|nr:carbohydrate ABC transporter permease [Thermotogota bacterium]HRW92447.1 carbohydrate ABC transporter permease [Thermotogota bacterium]